MGTRADFYVEHEGELAWLGSIAWDGYPSGLPAGLLEAGDRAAFTDALEHMAAERRDWTEPERGWPWPWEDSGTTDWAYVWAGDEVRRYCFGEPVPVEEGGDKPPPVEWPDMTDRQNVTFGARSGLIVVGLPADEHPEQP